MKHSPISKMIRVAVIGSAGQLGTDLVNALEGTGNYKVFPLSHEEIECTEPRSVRQVLTEVCPEVVVNCAAFVRVDECESHADEAFRINALGASYVARVCKELNALCAYISTDYVFDGEKGEPYTEEDLPHPINVYGTSKLAGEYLVQQGCPRWLIVRMASLFGKSGARGKGGNFVETILAKARAGENLRVVNDIRMSPAYTRDAAFAIERLLREEATGLFHVANSGNCTWYEFAQKVLELAVLDEAVDPVSSQDFSSKARRPRNSSLTSARLNGLVKRCLRPWDDALTDYLVEKGHRAP